MGYFNEKVVGNKAPLIEQGEEYVELMYDTLRSVNKDVTLTSRYPGKAFLLPGGVTEWSQPDSKMRTHIERDSHYSGLVRCIGESGRKLVVLECGTQFRPDSNDYFTQRNIYRLEWDSTRMIDAQVLRQEVVSHPKVIATAVPLDFRDDLILELLEEEEQDEYGNHIPSKSYRYIEQGLLTETDLLALHGRTLQFQDDLIAARGISYAEDVLPVAR